MMETISGQTNGYKADGQQQQQQQVEQHQQEQQQQQQQQNDNSASSSSTITQVVASATAQEHDSVQQRNDQYTPRHHHQQQQQRPRYQHNYNNQRRYNNNYHMGGVHHHHNHQNFNYRRGGGNHNNYRHQNNRHHQNYQPGLLQQPPMMAHQPPPQQAQYHQPVAYQQIQQYQYAYNPQPQQPPPPPPQQQQQASTSPSPINYYQIPAGAAGAPTAVYQQPFYAPFIATSPNAATSFLLQNFGGVSYQKGANGMEQYYTPYIPPGAMIQQPIFNLNQPPPAMYQPAEMSDRPESGGSPPDIGAAVVEIMARDNQEWLIAQLASQFLPFFHHHHHQHHQPTHINFQPTTPIFQPPMINSNEQPPTTRPLFADNGKIRLQPTDPVYFNVPQNPSDASVKEIDGGRSESGSGSVLDDKAKKIQKILATIRDRDMVFKSGKLWPIALEEMGEEELDDIEIIVRTNDAEELKFFESKIMNEILRLRGIGLGDADDSDQSEDIAELIAQLKASARIAAANKTGTNSTDTEADSSSNIKLSLDEFPKLSVSAAETPLDEKQDVQIANDEQNTVDKTDEAKTLPQTSTTLAKNAWTSRAKIEKIKESFKTEKETGKTSKLSAISSSSSSVENQPREEKSKEANEIKKVETEEKYEEFVQLVDDNTNPWKTVEPKGRLAFKSKDDNGGEKPIESKVNAATNVAVVTPIVDEENVKDPINGVGSTKTGQKKKKSEKW